MVDTASNTNGDTISSTSAERPNSSETDVPIQQNSSRNESPSVAFRLQWPRR